MRRAGEPVHRAALEVFRWLPVWARRRVVRTVSPSFTAGSLAVIRRGGDVLLIWPVYRRGWGLPGGLLSKGEPPQDAVLREVREETGLVIEATGPPRVVVDVMVRRIDFVFPCRVIDDEMAKDVRPCSVELSRAEWFPLDRLPPLLAETVTALEALAQTGDGPLILPLDHPSGWFS